MTVIYHIKQIETSSYITGWFSSSDPSSVQLSSVLEDVTQWFDSYGNPLWQLNADGSIVATSISPTAIQQSGKLKSDQVSAIAAALPGILQKMQSSPVPTDPWVVAFVAAIKAAVLAGERASGV